MAIRIDGPGRAGGAQSSGPTKRTGASGATFSLPAGEAATRAAAPTLAGTTGIGDIASLLALQGVAVPEDAREKKRKAVRRGLDLLDVLEGVKLDLLGGGVPTDRLERLVHLLGQRRPSGDERLDELVDDIELRVRVELAKYGRYPD